LFRLFRRFEETESLIPFLFLLQGKTSRTSDLATQQNTQD